MQRDPRPGARTEQEINAHLTSRQFHENDFVAPVINHEMTKEEDAEIREAFAKSYKVNNAFIRSEFKRLDDPKHPLYDTHMLYCIFIKGDFGDVGNKIKIDTKKDRLCYSMLVVISEKIKKSAAAFRQNTITSGTPLQTIYIGESMPQARVPKNRRLN